MGNPNILVLDEPTVGLDQIERKKFKDYIKDLSKDKIVIYCTHIATDVVGFADQLLFMKNGQITKRLDSREFSEYNKIYENLEDLVLENLE